MASQNVPGEVTGWYLCMKVGVGGGAGSKLKTHLMKPLAFHRQTELEDRG